MAAIIYSQPERYGLAYNDNPYVIRSSVYTPTQRFKITIVDSAFNDIATMLVYNRRGVTPTGTVTDNRAYFDPSRILQSKVGSCIAIPEASHAVYSDCSSLSYDYATVIREQDKVNGVYIDGDVTITDIKTIWNGGVNKIDWLDFDYTDYDMTNTASSKKFLTQSPSDLYIDSDQSLFLSFMSSDNDISQCNVTSYDSSGNQLDTGNFSLTMATQFGYIAIGTYDIENSDPSIWTGFDPTTGLNGASYYTVTMVGNNTQETFTIHINQKCSKYTPVRLHWLNRLGGFDAFNFSMKSTKSTDIKRASYLSQEHDFTGLRWQYDKSSRGTTDYHVGTQKKLIINTPYLTEAESIWMEDFATSPLIYMEVNNELIAMSGKPKKIDEQTSLNDKLMQYTFELDYSLNDMRQRG